MNDPISIYIHIPFCTRKCDYCHFYVLPDRLHLKSQLAHALELEWKLWEEKLEKRDISSIYFGGGTPTLFGIENLSKILKIVGTTSEMEITIEANPESLSYSLAKQYRDTGINRISIGIQSLDDQLLRILSRTHSSEKAIESIYIAKDAGFNNISIDLMYDIPTQTLEQWHTTLQKLSHLPISHLSFYNLTIEPHTVFHKKKLALESLIPDSQTSAEMYVFAQKFLKNIGLPQYEISAFAKQGFHSRHNTGYWLGREFIGLGPSAFSYWKGKRFRNIANLSRYHEILQSAKFPIDFEEELDPQAKKRELLVLSLRMIQGCDLQNFERRYGTIEEETQTNIDRLINEGFLFCRENILGMTEKGILFYDTIATELI